MKITIGPKWDKVHTEIKTLFDKITPQIDELQIQLQEKGLDLATEIDKFFKNELSDLIIYLSEEQSSHIELKIDDIERIKESLNPWTKVGGSFLLGAGTGTIAGWGTAGVTSSVFAPATLGNTILGAIGLKSSILVSASTYALLTTVAPIAVGLTLGVGVVGGSMVLFKKGEEKKASQFLADTIIASIPMMRADGHIHNKEKDSIYQMMNNSLLQKEDRQRIEDALNSNDLFEDLVKEGVISDPKKEKREIKRKLILTLAWEVAKADGHIHDYEIELHDRMARIMNIPQETVNEIRRLITPKLFLLPASSTSSNNTKDVEQKSIIDADIIDIYDFQDDEENDHRTSEEELKNEPKANNIEINIDHSSIDSNIQEIINKVQKTQQQKLKDSPANEVSQEQKGKDNDHILNQDIYQIINEQVNKAVQQEIERQIKDKNNTLTGEQIESEFNDDKDRSKQVDQGVLVKKEQYRQLILVKIDNLEKALHSHQITQAEYEIEMEKVRLHIESYKQFKG